MEPEPAQVQEPAIAALILAAPYATSDVDLKSLSGTCRFVKPLCSSCRLLSSPLVPRP